jgi:uncharacterized integral membrane protein
MAGALPLAPTAETVVAAPAFDLDRRGNQRLMRPDERTDDGASDDRGAARGDGAARTAGRTTRREYAGAGLAAGVVALLVLGIVLVALIAQNADAVPFQLLWLDAEISLAALLLGSAVGAVLVAELVGLVWRRRRRTLRAFQDSAPPS